MLYTDCTVHDGEGGHCGQRDICALVRTFGVKPDGEVVLEHAGGASASALVDARGTGAMAEALFEPHGRLFFGDNLEVLRRHIADESVDLVYLDPPFNSNRSYNVLFAHRSGRAPRAQQKAFDDTWRWDTAAARTYEAVVGGGGDVSRALRAYRELLGTNDLLAYLTMMTPRLVELHRVLKPTGSLYLHCDPTAAHYLKIILDAVFGPTNFRTEIVWKRTSAHSDGKQGRAQHGHVHDTILYYTKSDDWVWNPIFTPYDDDYLENEYRHVAPDGRRYKEADVTAAKPGGDTSYEWRVKRVDADSLTLLGADGKWEADLDDEWTKPKDGWEYLGVVPYNGRFWGYSKENMKQFAREGRLIHRRTGAPRLMLFSDEMPGVALQDLWTDVAPIRGGERLGYPTQKPVALMERIIASSTAPGDVVLDPFCGCGTTIHAAQASGREWVGIDITAVAIEVIRERLTKWFPSVDYVVCGEPSTIDEAVALAELDKHEFQRWALERVGIVGAVKKGADRGIDGEIVGVREDGSVWRCIVSVKGGNVNVTHLRDLHGTITREGADYGLLLSLKPSTGPMRREAADAGFSTEGHARLQIVTVEDLFAGHAPAANEASPVHSVEGKWQRDRKPSWSCGAVEYFTEDCGADRSDW